MYEPVQERHQQGDDHQQADAHHADSYRPSERNQELQEPRNDEAHLFLHLLKAVVVLHQALVFPLQSVELLSIGGSHAAQVRCTILSELELRLHCPELVTDRCDFLLHPRALLGRALPPAQPGERQSGHAVGSVEHPSANTNKSQARYGKRDRVQAAMLLVQQVADPPRRFLSALHRSVESLSPTRPEVQTGHQEEEHQSNEDCGRAAGDPATSFVAIEIEVTRPSRFAVEVGVGHHAKRQKKQCSKEDEVCILHLLL
mmetsp:Transcript_45494/g.97498  ORF Transcript_45494/g.97498 Transcript_45494/m.97498 type:complete len:258 (+) Transcript_45494:665-1438(+)